MNLGGKATALDKKSEDFYDDGNVYILSSDLLEKHNPTTCGDRPFQYHTHRYHNHEIDDDFDLMISEKIFEFKKV